MKELGYMNWKRNANAIEMPLINISSRNLDLEIGGEYRAGGLAKRRRKTHVYRFL